MIPGLAMSNTASTPDRKPPSPRQVLLGLFILAQIAFLITSNFLGFVRWLPGQKRPQPNELINRLAPRFADEEGHGWQWTEQIESNLRCWTDLTGQDQNWSLFAPSISKETSFPAVLLGWDDPNTDGPAFKGAPILLDGRNGFHIDALSVDAKAKARGMELLLSDNEPADLHRYLRIGNCRIRKFEGELAFNPQPNSREMRDTLAGAVVGNSAGFTPYSFSDETREELATRLHTRMQKFVRDYHNYTLSYLRWRLQKWQKEHPSEALPTQVILVERFFRIHGPHELWRGLDGPFTVPMVRWQPERTPKDGFFVLEPFDFNQEQFIPMMRH